MLLCNIIAWHNSISIYGMFYFDMVAAVALYKGNRYLCNVLFYYWLYICIYIGTYILKNIYADSCSLVQYNGRNLDQIQNINSGCG